MGQAIQKVVFQPPPRLEEPPSKKYIELKTSEGNTVSAYHVDLGYDITVLFSHGNAEDVPSLILYFQNVFCPKLQVNCFMYDYSGYGYSTGEPSEKNVYADADAALSYLLNDLKVPGSKIVLYGRSLGSGPSCYLAHKYDKQFLFRGVILQSPIMSIFRVAVKSPVTVPGDMFPNVDRVKKFRSPVIIVHGVLDKIVPFEHGSQLFAKSISAIDCLWLADAGHNNLETNCGKLLLGRYYRFIHKLTLNYDPATMKTIPQNFEGSRLSV